MTWCFPLPLDLAGTCRPASLPKTFTGRRAQPCLATTAAAAVAAAGFLVVCPDVAAAAASGAIRGRPLETVIVVDAGSSGCRLNVYQVEWEVRRFAAVPRRGWFPRSAMFGGVEMLIVVYRLGLLDCLLRRVPGHVPAHHAKPRILRS